MTFFEIIDPNKEEEIPAAEETKEISALEALQMQNKRRKPRYFYSTPLTDALDQCLIAGQNNTNQLPPALPVFGMTGSGKTAKVRSWLEFRDLKAIYIDATFTQIEKEKIQYTKMQEMADNGTVGIFTGDLTDMLEIKEKDVNVIFTPEQIDTFDQNTVVVIDNYTWTKKEQRDELNKLIFKSCVVDPRVGGTSGLKRVPMLMLVLIGETGVFIENRNDFTEAEMKNLGLEEYLEYMIK